MLSFPDTLATLYILIRCLLLMLVIMRLLFHVYKYDDDDKLIGLCVKDHIHQCTCPPLLLCKGPALIFYVCLTFQ